jgi:uncharacterized SAM-binding protein YcdF (DUF218 family)
MVRRPDVLCISSIDWDFIWQGHQEIMSALAAAGHRVLFIENTGVRPPTLRDLPRMRQRLRNWWQGTKGFRRVGENLFVYAPLIVPLPYSRVARWINRVLLLRAVRRWMGATGFHRPITWTFLPTPLARDIIQGVESAVTVYYCIDDFASSSHEARRIRASEEQMFREADLVFVTSAKLRDRAAQFSERVHLFPFGVNFAAFARVRESRDEAPTDLRALTRPIVGYVGGLHQWVDQALVRELAARMPDVTFAMVGPTQCDVSELRRESNIHLLGVKPHADVPRYVKAFDVGVVPYKLTDYTANVYPTKLNEYLAVGVPVVTTDLPEIRRFNTRHGGVVAVAEDAEAFAAAIRAALNDSKPADVARRLAVAHENSWESRIAEMGRLVDEALDRRAVTEARWDETLLRVYRRTRTRTAQIVLALAAVYFVIFHTNVVWWAAGPLKLTAAPRPADAIVVFAGGVGESGRAGGGAQERIKQAVDLYKAGHARFMVLSSGYVYSFREAEVMRALAVDQGVPASNIVLEERAANTYQNVVFVADILRDHRWTSILLVSSPYHMRRAVMVWRKVAPNVAVVPAPPSQSQFYDHTRGATLEQLRGIAQEYVAIFAYWRRGWV